MSIFKLFYLAVSCVSVLGCSSLMYQPSKGMIYPPKHVQGLHAPEDIRLPVEAGVELHGWYFRAKGPEKGVVLYFHGNAENLTSHYLNLVWLLEKGYSFVIWDYRGYGQSSGTPDPENVVADGKRWLKYTSKRFVDTPLFVFGHSLGAQVALRVVGEMGDTVPIEGVSVAAGFLSFRSLGAEILSRLWLFWPFQWLPYVLVSDSYAAKGWVEKISPIPLQVLHGTEDPVINYHFGTEIFKNAKAPKQMNPIPDGDHNDFFWREKGRYRSVLLDFLNKHQAKER